MGRKHWYERERQEPRGGTRELFRVGEGRPLGREKTEKEGREDRQTDRQAKEWWARKGGDKEQRGRVKE